MTPAPPRRILFLRPDAYGDLFLFEPVPRILRHLWPQTEVAVLIRQPYADVAPLFGADGIRWLMTACNPYREAPGDHPAALASLRETVQAFAPDCVVAACGEQTWLEAAVASFLPPARQISLGAGLTDPLARAALDAVLPVDWAAIYPEKIAFEPAQSEWEKNLRLADALLGEAAPRWWPVARVPPDAERQAAQILADAGLGPGGFVACAAAGTANVQIKSWPAEHYGATLAWLEREHGIRALLIGHVSEQARLEAVRTTARAAGADPALWLGEDGEMPVVAGLLAAARFYFGHDTGALHLAAALGRPVVPIFGGGHWPRFQPVARRSVTVVQPLPCFGCAWDCYFADAPCVHTISVRSVQQALTRFLRDDAAEQIVFEAEGMDAGARALIKSATPQLQFRRADRVARLRQTRELSVLLAASEGDRAARFAQVDELTAQLKTSEADRDARQLQVAELTAQLRTSETDRDARRLQIMELTALHKSSEADRDARQVQITELTEQLQSSETDRAARRLQITELTALHKSSEADRDARQVQITELTTMLQSSEADRDARFAQITELTAQLLTSDDDRAARGEQITQLTAWLRESEADRNARGQQIVELTALLRPAEDPGHQVAPPVHREAMPSTEPAAGDAQDLLATSRLTAPPASGKPLPVLTGVNTHRGGENYS